MNTCRFCTKPCGEREFCDEVCYSEYQEEMAVWQASIADEYPVGESRYDDSNEPVFPVNDGDF